MFADEQPNTTYLPRYLPDDLIVITFYYEFENDSKNKVVSQKRNCGMWQKLYWELK